MERLRGCFSGYGGHTFQTKADRIMSRYRPIAPKPVMPSLSEVERSVSSAVTVDHLCTRQALVAPSASTTCKQKGKRVRKRPNKDSEWHVQPTKRMNLEAPPNQLSEKPPSFNVLGCASVSGDVAPTPIQEDAGFMERAAASAPASVFSLERLKPKIGQSNSYGYGGCFTEFIRGIAGLPTTNHVHNLLQQQNQQHHHHQLPSFLNVLPQQCVKVQIPKQHQTDICVHGHESQGGLFSKNETFGDAGWSCISDLNQRESAHERDSSEDAQQSGLDEEGVDGLISENKGLVTLNLLSDVPLTAESPTFSSSSCESSHVDGCGTGLAFIERVYGHSSEPAILTHDETHKLLWANQAYLKACRENNRVLAPFIDPLGFPTQMGQFRLQLESHGECIPATLWGFLKKFVVDVARDNKQGWLARVSDGLSSGAFENKCAPSPTPRHGLGLLQLCCRSQNSTAVIIPQPVRLVGSVVSVESLSEILVGEAMSGNLDIAKRDLEEGSMPGLITDASNTVRWVNTAYKAMVGQPECPWLASTMKEECGASATIAGEVLLSCNVEVPSSASSFSGRANVQWTRNTGERTCMTLPCDVSALTDGHLKKMLVWRFDIQASLSLSCRTEL